MSSNALIWTQPRGQGGKVYLDTLAPVTDLVYESTYPGGSSVASCTIDLSAVVGSAAFTEGIRTGITVGALDVWVGVVNSPATTDRHELAFTGEGALLGWYAAYSSTVDNAYDLNAVFDACVLRGLPLQRASTLPSAPGKTAPGASILLDQAFDDVSRDLNRYWQVRDGIVSMPATVGNGEQYMIVGVSGADGRTLDGYSARVFLPYNDSTAVARRVVSGTVTNRIVTKESILDYTGTDGQYTNVQAQAIADAQVARLGKASNFTGSFDLVDGQLLTLGGSPVDLASVRAGFTAQIISVDPYRSGSVIPGVAQVVIGTCRYQQETRTLTCTPLDARERDTVSTIAQVV